jgi:HEAT repeat protein
MKDKRAVLIERFNQESFYAPKANIVKQLANDNNGKSKLLIKKAFQDEDVQVRRAAIAQVDVISKELLPLFEARLYDSSYVNIEKVLVKLIKQFPENSEKYLESTEADAKGHDLFNITHLRLKVENGNDQSLPNLVDFAGPSFEFRTRIKAIEALTSLEYQEEDFINPLIEASVNFNRRLASVARNSLVTLTSSLKDKYVIKQLIGERSFDKNEMKRLEVLESKLDL